MIKIINDFLPKPLFNYLLGVVEHDTLNWNWNDRNLQVNDPTPGGKEVKLGKTLFVDSQLSGMGKEVYDKEIMPLFGVFMPSSNRSTPSFWTGSPSMDLIHASRSIDVYS